MEVLIINGNEYREVFCRGVRWHGYYVGTNGELWSMRRCKKPRLRKPYDAGFKMSCTLQRDGKGYNVSLHKIVIETYIGPQPCGMEVCHNDGDYTNNTIQNLRYDSRDNNERDKLKHGTSNRGSRHGISKINESTVLQIKRMIKDGYRNITIQKATGASRGMVTHIKKGSTWSWLSI